MPSKTMAVHYPSAKSGAVAAPASNALRLEPAPRPAEQISAVDAPPATRVQDFVPSEAPPRAAGSPSKSKRKAAKQRRHEFENARRARQAPTKEYALTDSAKEPVSTSPERRSNREEEFFDQQSFAATEEPQLRNRHGPRREATKKRPGGPNTDQQRDARERDRGDRDYDRPRDFGAFFFGDSRRQE